MSHKSEARRLVSRAHRAIEVGGRVDAAALAMLANAEATLALAEQQRVANLIALAKYRGPNGEVLSDQYAGLFSPLVDGTGEVRLLPDVCEALEL